jgi:hypothetical protein
MNFAARAGSTSYNGLAAEIESLIALKGSDGELKANFPYQPYHGHKKDLLGTVAASDRILRLMNRGYKAQEFLDALRGIKAACPTLLVKTQIIVMRRYRKLFFKSLFQLAPRTLLLRRR